MSDKSNPRLLPPMTIGVMGSAGGDIKDEDRQKLQHLGSLIAQRGHVLITGACPGLPHEAALGAAKEGGCVVGVSPALNLEEHIAKYNCPTRGYTAIIYTGNGLMGREVENIRSCDAVIFAGGRSGTLGEFAIAYDEGKVIGVLTDTGGITDYFDDIVNILNKDTGAIIFYEDDPKRLLDELEDTYKQRILPRHSEMIKKHNPDGVAEV